MKHNHHLLKPSIYLFIKALLIGLLVNLALWLAAMECNQRYTQPQSSPTYGVETLCPSK
jgi:hypothetical protein